jgi:membrane protein
MALRGVKDLGLPTLRRVVEIEGPQHATVLAAQAFTSLIPFLVIVAAFGPGEGNLADRIVERFDLDRAAEQNARSLFSSAGETRNAVSWLSVVILVLAATSFSRAMQRLFERAYRVEPGGLKQSWRALAWLAGFAVWVVASGPVRAAVDDSGGIVLAVAISAVMGFALWLGTPLVLLGGIQWRRLVPGAAVIAVLVSLAAVASAIYVPVLMTWSGERYGLIGIAVSLQSWLVVMGFVVVTGAVFGAVIGDRSAPAAVPVKG